MLYKDITSIEYGEDITNMNQTLMKICISRDFFSLMIDTMKVF